MIVNHAAHNGSVTMEGAGIDCRGVMSGLVVMTAFWVPGSSAVEWHSPRGDTRPQAGGMHIRRQFSFFAKYHQKLSNCLKLAKKFNH